MAAVRTPMAMANVADTLRLTATALGMFGSILRERARLCLVVFVVGVLVALRSAYLGLGIAVLPVLWIVVGVLWAAIRPGQFTRVLGPYVLNLRILRYYRENWYGLAVNCSLGRRLGDGSGQYAVPQIRTVETRPGGTVLTIRARSGQTAEEIIAAAPALADSIGAASFTAGRVGPGLARLELTMGDNLAAPQYACHPRGIATESVPLGRTQAGDPWVLRLHERHTLVVGASGSGKGSILWGIAGNLAPAVQADVVRLWGIDLKGGIELGMGEPLFAHVAVDESAALRVLDRLRSVMAERQRAMYGRARSFHPAPGDPVHVLVVDELAVLTAYASRETVREATRLLSVLLTQGRALGIYVVAFVQDPRKETVGMRGLFTQTVALRLTSATETRMVLGEGMAELAPAHQLLRSRPGTAYVIGDDGSVEHVWADYWPDHLIRDVSARYPCAVVEELSEGKEPKASRPETNDAAEAGGATAPPHETPPATPSEPRKRSPRKPRASTREHTAEENA